MNKWIGILVVALLMFGYRQIQHMPKRSQSEHANIGQSVQQSKGDVEQVIQQAFQKHQSNIQVEGEGVVNKTLPDDNKGSRHQRFVVKLADGHTVLIAHNIDLAEKIKGLKKGDRVGFYGEYEWSEQGGVIHWTHKDPNAHHVDGWLKYQGKLYQ